MNSGFETRRAGSGILNQDLQQSAIEACRKAIRNLNAAKSSYDESDASEWQLMETEREVAECVLRLHARDWSPGSQPAAVRIGDTTYVAIGDECDMSPRLLVSKEVTL